MMLTEPRDLLTNFATFTIAHPYFKLALDTIYEAIETTEICSEPSSVLLLGNGGTGKTRICKLLAARFGVQETKRSEEEIILTKPIINCPVPPHTTLKGLVERMLRELGAVNNNQSFGRLEYKLYTLLDTCQTKLVMLDEWQHLLSRGAEKTREAVGDWVKVLTDSIDGTVILSGTLKSEIIINEDDQLTGRFPYRAYLRNFSIDNKTDKDIFIGLICAFTGEIKRTMPFEEIVAMTDENILLALYAFTAGNLRTLRLTLHTALRCALERGDRQLLDTDLAYAASRIKSPKRLINKNPFEVSFAELQKALYRSNL
ncbi:TniB family NTP-binding protein [Pseudomonas sp. QE6]|uniref:TniB family NTP-binding protein n=1 Tax=Pseudomonas sp. QE6 TaxID=3242491 RepID=UPI003529CFAF